MSDGWQAIALGTGAYVLNRWLWDAALSRRITRKRLLEALQAETETAERAVRAVFGDVEDSLKKSGVLVSICAGKTPITHEAIHALSSGWILYAPALNLMDIIDRLRPYEANPVIVYVDRWARLIEHEKRYSRWFEKLLDLMEDREGKTIENGVQALEAAHQVCDTLKSLREVAASLLSSTHVVRRMCVKGLREPWYGAWAWFLNDRRSDENVEPVERPPQP